MPLRPFFKKNRSPGAEPPDRFDVPGTLYAIGDVHGMSSLLDGLLARICDDAARPETQGPKTLVFMGDYIDRGDDSRGALERLRQFHDTWAEKGGPVEPVYLIGNHDAMMLDFIQAPLEHRQWLDWGGLQTLVSFGVAPVLPGAADEAFFRLADELRAALGDLRGFLERRTVLLHQSGNVFFSHAGAKPEIPLSDQPERVLLWGSRSFMETGGPPGNWYVHGHTIVSEPAIVGNRIAIDTGAFASGVLTAARITREGCAFLQHS